MTHELNCCDSFESLKLKVVLWEADTPGCRIVGNDTALGSGGPADKLVLGDLNNIVLGVVGELSADSDCKAIARHRALWWSILPRRCS